MEDCYEKMSNAVPEASVASADPCIGKRTRKARRGEQKVTEQQEQNVFPKMEVERL